MIQGSKGYWLTTPILAIQVFTDHMQVRELLHLMGVEQAERNMASVHQKIYIVQWIFRAITRISHKRVYIRRDFAFDVTPENIVTLKHAVYLLFIKL